MQLNFGQLLYNLFNLGVTNVKQRPAEATDLSTPTSIRLSPNVRRFYEAQAEAMGGISFQAAITMALTGLAEISMAGAPYDDPKHALKTIRDRFFLVFKESRVDLVDIPSILHDFGFTLSALTDPGRLEDLLRPRLIDFIAAEFGVNAEWLKGKSDTVSDSKLNWYKAVTSAILRLSAIAKTGATITVYFVRRAGADFAAALASNDDHEDREPVGIVIRIDRKTADGVPYTTFEKWEFDRWNYWRTRQQYKLMMTFCDQASHQHRFSCAGIQLDAHVFDQLRDGKCLPATAMNNRSSSSMWHPEDYASLRADPKRWVTKEIDDFDKNVLPEYQRMNYDQYLDAEYWYPS
jgi:hypothetical protein